MSKTPYSTPANESRRLAMLAQYHIMDTEPEPAFDRIAELVRQFFDVPVVAITFLDENTQFFKSLIGYNLIKTPRAFSICNYTLQSSEAFIVPDLTQHPDLKSHILVTGSPFMRFYAGMPLEVTDDTGEKFILGSLCLMDIQPRDDFSATQIANLERFAQIVTDALELRLQQNTSQKSSELKSAFIANMSHEIRTHMNGIVGMMDLLKHTPLDPQQLDYLNNMATSSENLLAVINDIFDLSHIESGQIQLQKQAVDLFALSQDLVQQFTPIAQDKKLNLSLNYQATKDSPIQVDPVRLKQVLSTLMQNAIKFTPAYGEVTLLVTKNEQDQTVLIQLIDSGIGIKPESQAVIFDAYNQADKFTHRLYAGTGLSLSVSKLLIEKMGGTMSVASRADVFPQQSSQSGTVFSIVLPIEEVHTIPKSTQDTTTTAATERRWLADRLPAQVLLVEDDTVSAMIAKKALQKFGYETTWVKDGQQAIDTYLKTPDNFQVILMDHQMPILDGVSAVRKLTKLAQNLPPIIAVTAHATHSDTTLYLEAGMQDYCAKPYKPEYLDYLIQHWLHQYAK